MVNKNEESPVKSMFRPATKLEENLAKKSSEMWRDAFKINQSLLHLDISNNNFSQLDLEVMNEGLKENHSILGLHMMGNEGSTDAYGFIHPDKEQISED